MFIICMTSWRNSNLRKFDICSFSVQRLSWKRLRRFKKNFIKKNFKTISEFFLNSPAPAWIEAKKAKYWIHLYTYKWQIKCWLCYAFSLLGVSGGFKKLKRGFYHFSGQNLYTYLCLSVSYWCKLEGFELTISLSISHL